MNKLVKIYEPKTIEDAIRTLQQFLECDLYSKFRPEEELNGEVWVRDNQFKDKNDFEEYIEEHFSILFKQIKKLKDGEVRDNGE